MEKEYSYGDNRREDHFSLKLKAGKRRTYFFDIRSTRNRDYYLTITESRKRPDDMGYERHKLCLYKEDFNKFQAALNQSLSHVKEQLLPEYDFDEYSDRSDRSGLSNQREQSLTSDNVSLSRSGAGGTGDRFHQENLEGDSFLSKAADPSVTHMRDN